MVARATGLPERSNHEALCLTVWPTMNVKDQARHSSLIEVFEDVVPAPLLLTINATIDATQSDWQPADGRREAVMARSFAEQLRENARFYALESQVCSEARQWSETALKRDISDMPLHVLRCVGPAAAKQSYLRHFDSHVLTMLIPLRLAEQGESNGDLVLHIRQRAVKWALLNLLTKMYLFFEHGLPFFLRSALVARSQSIEGCERIQCIPGNVYVFNGLVTLHHNLDVAVGERRTLIIHHYDAGLSVGARYLMRSVRNLRDRLAWIY